MGARDAVKALAEGQRAARNAAPEWGRATRQKLWPKANAQLGARPQANPKGSPASPSPPSPFGGSLGCPLPPEPRLWYPSASGGTDLRTRH
jgi:hypothetical protein